MYIISKRYEQESLEGKLQDGLKEPSSSNFICSKRKWHHYRLSLSSTGSMQTTRQGTLTSRIAIVIPGYWDHRQSRTPATSHPPSTAYNVNGSQFTKSTNATDFVSMLRLHKCIPTRKMFTAPSTTRNSGKVGWCGHVILAGGHKSSANTNSYRFRLHQQIAFHSFNIHDIFLSRHLMLVFG